MAKCFGVFQREPRDNRRRASVLPTHCTSVGPDDTFALYVTGKSADVTLGSVNRNGDDFKSVPWDLLFEARGGSK